MQERREDTRRSPYVLTQECMELIRRPIVLPEREQVDLSSFPNPEYRDVLGEWMDQMLFDEACEDKLSMFDARSIFEEFVNEAFTKRGE